MNPEEKNRMSANPPTNTGSEDQDELNQMKRLLRQAMPPLPPNQLEPRIDLWPQLHARIEAQLVADHAAGTSRASSSVQIRIPWFDWALAAVAAAALIFCPGIIPALLYHF